jgi:hypothetical protein
VTLRTLVVADAAVFVVAAIVFVALFPSNVDTRDPSSLYTVAFWIASVSLLVLIIAALIAIGRRFARSP